MRKIWQAKYQVFFIWMLIIPGLIAYLGGWDTQFDYLFLLKAFAIALLSTVIYFILTRNFSGRKAK